MKTTKELAAVERAAAPKDIEYKYIYTPPVGGESAGAVCVG